MSFENDFKEYFIHSIILSAYTSQDGYGKPVYLTGTTYSARVVNSVKLIMDGAGQEKVSGTQIWIATSSAISTRDRITLPAQFTPRSPTIMRVDVLPDDDGVHHVKIFA